MNFGIHVQSIHFINYLSTYIYKNLLMSIIVAKGETICKSPINTSKSKLLYSIPKDERFKKLKLSGYSKNNV